MSQNTMNARLLPERQVQKGQSRSSGAGRPRFLRVPREAGALEGQFVSAEGGGGGGDVNANRTKADIWETFNLGVVSNAASD